MIAYGTTEHSPEHWRTLYDLERGHNRDLRRAVEHQSLVIAWLLLAFAAMTLAAVLGWLT